MSYFFRIAIAGLPAALLLLVAAFFYADIPDPAALPEATLSLVTEKNELRSGEEFFMDIIIDAADAINVIEATLHYPPELLEVLEIDSEDSVLGLWVQDPEYFNEEGRIHFSGGLYGEGHTGEGVVARVHMRAVDEGRAQITFSDTAVFAHDGEGTDVIHEALGAVYEIIIEDLPPARESFGGGAPIPPAASEGAGEAPEEPGSEGEVPERGTMALSADLTGSGVVDVRDLGIMMSAMRGEYDPRFDLNDDGKIDVVDLGILLSSFGR